MADLVEELRWAATMVHSGPLEEAADEIERLRGELERLRGGDPEQTDPEVEAACRAYLLAWRQMTEEARRERRKRMKLALDAAAAVRLMPSGEPPHE
jgi:hypothetical protein